MLACVLVALLFCTPGQAGPPKKVIFTVLGDWGIPNLPYTAVMAKVSDAQKSQFTVAVGDNFYKGVSVGGTQHGVESISDPKWQSIFEKQFTQPFFKKNWYVIAGNHDYDGNEMAQVQYTKVSPGRRWKFPSLYYTFKKYMAQKVSVQFFMIDSQPLYLPATALKAYGRTKDFAQLKWIERQLKQSTATWKIMFAHHPIYTSKGKREWLIDNLVPLLHKYKVALFVSGHMHTFQHMKTPKLDYITVGSTGIQQSVPIKNVGGVRHVFSYPTQAQDQSPQCANDVCRGFAIVTVQGRGSLTLKFYNTQGKLIYTTNPIKNPNI